MSIKKAPTAATATETLFDNHPNNTIAAQRQAIYQHLAAGHTLTTLYAREVMGILRPAAWVMELRKRGHNIVTHWRVEEDVTGKTHRVAEYALFNKEVDHAA